MSETRIALTVDNPDRDLPGLVLLAHRLSQQGVRSFLVPYNRQFHETLALAPDFALLNFLRTANQDFARNLLDAGIPYGVLDTEGGVLASPESFGATMATDELVRAGSRCVFSWGRVLAEHAEANGWYSSDQLVVSGAPRLDYYHADWRRATAAMSDYVDRYARNLILINSNFTIANPRFTTPSREVQVYVEQFGQDPAPLLAAQRTQEGMLDGFVLLARTLAERFPQATIVYRPHPFERLETYHARLAGIPNLHAVQVGTVDGWILRARAVIQFSCSTSIEAGIMGVPSLTPAWVAPPTGVREVEEVSVHSDTLDDLVETVGAVLRGEWTVPAAISQRLEEVIDDWFYRIDGRAHERVADRIVREAVTTGRRARVRTSRELIHAALGSNRTPRGRLRKKLLDLTGLSPYRSYTSGSSLAPDAAEWIKSGKSFDAGRVDRILQAITTTEQARSGQAPRSTRARAADSADYAVPFPGGRSVVIDPAH